jgi:TRAP-type mannitol/chloroaromatic compound transport system permease large subunit
MSDPSLGLAMLGLIVIAIMMGFPTAFTLMGLGMVFGFVAFWTAGQPWYDNRVFDLIAQRTYGVMVNDTLLSVPLFVFMGYVMERAALVDKMFHSIQLAFRRVPGSLAVTTLIVCTFWGIASGLVGAVVVLMGVIAMRPMLNAGYDTRLAAGVITAGGTLGILIPPSVMIIVYAAVAGQSVVKLYAAAMFPGFFLSLLYLLYILGWAILQPKVAPKLPPEKNRAPIAPWVAHLASTYSPRMLPALLRAVVAPAGVLRTASADMRLTYRMLLGGLVSALMPLLLVAATLGSVWWYVTIYSQKVDTGTPVEQSAPAGAPAAPGAAPPSDAPPPEAPAADALAEPPGGDAPAAASDELQAPAGSDDEKQGKSGGPEKLERFGEAAEAAVAPPIPAAFYIGFFATCAVVALALFVYYGRMDAESFEILRMVVSSAMPLAVLTLVVLGVILFGITTATESAAIGAAGAFLMAWQARTLTFRKIQEAVFLTMKTTAMVCWLFVGSALFSAVFAILGGQRIIEEWVLGMNLSPLQFLLLSQAIIFILGWPLEWTEIIVIFIPIFLPLLAHFQIDPLLFGVLVFVNLQAAFLSPPVAMSAFYLKGVSPPHVTLNQIFAGMMPYMLIVILCMVFMYIWPGLTLWLPNYLYGVN